MEELQAIVEMIAKLPQTALWVLIGFWTYKVVVVGSIYGLIRFAIDKLHSWLTTPKHELIQVRPMLDKITITGDLNNLIDQLRRLVRKEDRFSFIHDSDIQWLKAAIDEKMAKDGKK